MNTVKMNEMARPRIEEWISQATNENRISIDEFISCVTKTADSGSVVEVLKILIACCGKDYLYYVMNEDNGIL